MLLMDLDPADQRPVYRQIVAEVQRCVAVGVVRPGEALPSAAALAKDLKLNINTVQHAYRTLAQEGTVYVKRGMGTYVAAVEKETRQRQAVSARRIAERMLREAFKHGLLASDLMTALEQIAPKGR